MYVIVHGVAILTLINFCIYAVIKVIAMLITEWT